MIIICATTITGFPRGKATVDALESGDGMYLPVADQHQIYRRSPQRTNLLTQLLFYRFGR